MKSIRAPHPLFSPFDLRLSTPAMKTLHEQITRWLWTGCTGAFLCGESRCGKTTALETIADQLEFRDKRPVPVHFVTIPMRDRSTITSLYRILCLSAALPLTSRLQSDHLASKFISHLLDLAAQYEAQTIVLIIDEFQRLSPLQISAFAEVHDQLRTLGLGSLMIFAGNTSESSFLLEHVSKPECAHVRGRFFTQSATFLGLTSAKDVKHCLHQYDTLRFPEETGPTYTEYFVPEAFQAGWRLSLLASALWQGFKDIQTQYALDSWPMHYFCITVNLMLTDLLPQIDPNETDQSLIQHAIDLSGICPSIQIKGTP